MLNRSPLRPVPPGSPEAGIDGWKTIGASLAGETLVDAIQTKDIDPVVRGYGRLIDAYQSGDTATFNREVKKLLSEVDQRSKTSGKLRFETFFNQYQPFYLSMILYILALLTAAASWLVWGKPLGRAAFWLLVFAFLVHNYGLIARMFIQERPPVTNLYSSAVFIGWASVLLGILLEYIHRNGIGSVAAALIGFSTLVIAHNLAILEQGDTMGPPRAVLDSNFWLSIHVITVTIGYSATFLAGILAIVYLACGLGTATIDERLARVFSGMVYGIVCFALLFSFVGTVTGGIWADQSWGRFWGWDPKENGALMIVLWNALILHARWGGVVRSRGLMSLAIGGNIITAWSWFGTNMLGVGLHSYGFMDSAFLWLVAFVASQLACIGVAMLVPRKCWASPAAAGAAPAVSPPTAPSPAPASV
jgi:ABC-type transport system involved in cytochrome c biogenesis permease subunit